MIESKALIQYHILLQVIQALFNKVSMTGNNDDTDQSL